MTKLLDELRSMLTTELQKEKLEQIENCQLSLIALSEKDAYIEGFKLGTILQSPMQGLVKYHSSK